MKILEYKDYVRSNSEAPALTKSTYCPQHGGGSDFQSDTLQKIETRYYETITKEHFCSTIMLLKKPTDSRIS